MRIVQMLFTLFLITSSVNASNIQKVHLKKRALLEHIFVPGWSQPSFEHEVIINVFNANDRITRIFAVDHGTRVEQECAIISPMAPGHTWSGLAWPGERKQEAQ